MVVLYNVSHWMSTVFFYHGTVLPYLRNPLIIIGVWSFVAHNVIVRLDFDNPAKKAFDLYGHFVIFFVVFRTNSAYVKYWQGSRHLKKMIVQCRELHQTYLCYIKGGMLAQDEEQKRLWEASGVRAKTDATRYILAFLVLTKIHAMLAYDGYCRGFIDNEKWDLLQLHRARVRGLLTKEEFLKIDGLMGLHPTDDQQGPGRSMLFRRRSSNYHPIEKDVSKPRPVCLVIYFLVCLHRDCAVFGRQWGYLERCMNLAASRTHLMLDMFETMSQSISTPAPLPLNHLCKFLMGGYILLFPFMMTNPLDGGFIAVLTSLLISLVVCGLEAISMEIEDPWGEDDNDLNLVEMIHEAEATMYELMVLRKDPSVDNFLWIQPPENSGYPGRFLCLVSERDAVLALWPECTAALPKLACDPVRPYVTSFNLVDHLNTPRSRFAARPGGASLWRLDRWSWSMFTPRKPPEDGARVFTPRTNAQVRQS